MRTILSGLLACLCCLMATLSVYSQPEPPRPPGLPAFPGQQPVSRRAQPDRLSTGALGLPGIMVPSVAPSLDQDKDSAGLSRDSQPERLTWERVYLMTLIRDRDGRGGLLKSFDPKALAQQVSRIGVADFGRFRERIMTSWPGTDGAFHDPSADYLDLLRRLQRIDNARRSVAILENLKNFVVDLVQGEALGLSQIDVDLVFAETHRSQQDLREEICHFRDHLDQFKVAIGLSPRAPVIPDRQALSRFHTAFGAVESWSKNPERGLNKLRDLTQQFPAIGDLIIEGKPIPPTMDANPAEWEDIVGNAVQTAIKNRGKPDKNQDLEKADAHLELKIRRLFRHLLALQRTYESEKRSYELCIRLSDQSFERLTSPASTNASGRSPLLEGLLEHVTRTLKSEDKLVTLWTTFRAERLALYRELGTLPYTDWLSFYKDLSAE